MDIDREIGIPKEDRTPERASSSSFLLRQAFADNETLTRSLQVDLSLALSVASRIAIPCALMSSIILSIHVLLVFLCIFSRLLGSVAPLLVSSIFHSRYMP